MHVKFWKYFPHSGYIRLRFKGQRMNQFLNWNFPRVIWDQKGGPFVWIWNCVHFRVYLAEYFIPIKANTSMLFWHIFYAVLSWMIWQLKIRIKVKTHQIRSYLKYFLRRRSPNWDFFWFDKGQTTWERKLWKVP